MERLSDVFVSCWLTDWCKEVGLNPKLVSFKTDHESNTIYIFTQYPGILIGYHGTYSSKYKQELEKVLEERRVKAPYKYQLVEVTIADRWVHDECLLDV